MIVEDGGIVVASETMQVQLCSLQALACNCVKLAHDKRNIQQALHALNIPGCMRYCGGQQRLCMCTHMLLSGHAVVRSAHSQTSSAGRRPFRLLHLKNTHPATAK